MPPDFSAAQEARLWTPLAATPALAQIMAARGALWLEVIGRIKEDQTREAAQIEMSAIMGRPPRSYAANHAAGTLRTWSVA